MKSRMFDISVGDVYRSNFKQNDGSHWIAIVVGFNYSSKEEILVRTKILIDTVCTKSKYYAGIYRFSPSELESRWTKLKS